MLSTSSPPEGVALRALLDVQAVAHLLDCSPRHVNRLSDAGMMPPPVRLGSLVRWDRLTIEKWIRDGCRPMEAAIE